MPETSGAHGPITVELVDPDVVARIRWLADLLGSTPEGVVTTMVYTVTPKPAEAEVVVGGYL